MKKTIYAALCAALLALSAPCEEFVSAPFRLDMRLENGVRVAEAVEIIEADATWAGEESDAARVAEVSWTPPGGETKVLHATTSLGAESFVWDAKRATAGEHVFTHTVKSGARVLASETVRYSVPEPVLGAAKIFGPASIHGGNSASYVCMGYYSDDSGREAPCAWTLAAPVAGVAIDENGVLTAEESRSDRVVTVRADAGGGIVAEYEVSVLASYLRLGQNAASVANAAGRASVTVACSGAWTAESNAAWLRPVESGGTGDGLLVFEFDKNPETASRKGVVTVKCWQLTAKLTVKQSAGERETRVSVAFDACGGTAGYAEHEYIEGEEYGTLPSAPRPGMVFAGWWTAPGGEGERVLATTPASAGITRLYAFWREESTGDILGNALDWLDGEGAAWTIDRTRGKDANGSMRSGAIGDGGVSTLAVEITGPGEISFWWKASSEEYFDCVYFRDDGEEIAELSGETPWEHFRHEISDSGTHVLEWRFEKDDADGAGYDCAWLDAVVWTPGYSENEIASMDAQTRDVPAAWRRLYGISASASPDADSDGDGMSDWEEYATGTNPADPASKFTATIEMDGDTPIVAPSPDLGDALEYIIEGKENLEDEDWVAPAAQSHRFFRIKAVK